VALSTLSESDWDQVFALATAGQGRSRDAYLQELRSQGLDAHLLAAVELQMELGEPPQRPDRHRRGERIGAHLELRGHLRDGGASTVYLGVYDEGDRVIPVAVKMLRLAGTAEQRATLKDAWQRELRLLREFSDSGTVSPLIEGSEHASRGEAFLYLCTEYKHGLSLTRWCEQHGLELADRIELFAQVCEAVATVHAHGLIHGDLKPDNVQVEMRNGKPRAWLLDLGLAATHGQRWHAQDQLIGSPGYMSPEQISDRYGPVTEATDVYALGMMLFELLEGRPWLDVRGVTTAEALHTRVAQTAAPRLTTVAPASARARLQSILERATAYRPPDRYSQMSMLRTALAKLDLNEGPPATTEGTALVTVDVKQPAAQPSHGSPNGHAVTPVLRWNLDPARRLASKRSAAALALCVVGGVLAFWAFQGGSSTSDPGKVRTEPLKDAQPGDPGSTLDAAKLVKIGMQDTATLTAARPLAYYKFDNQLKVRDQAIVRLEMLSPGVCPAFTILDEDGKEIVSDKDSTPGAAIQRTVAVQPNKPISVRVGTTPYCPGQGKVAEARFKLSMVQQGAFDRFEANDTGLEATPMKAGEKVAANIMDKEDVDWYRVAGTASGRLTLQLENRSSTLSPIVVLYNKNKSEQLRKHDDTPGANLVFPVEVEPGSDFYVSVLAGPQYRYTSYGAYELLLSVNE